jgi:hypothetical protein
MMLGASALQAMLDSGRHAYQFTRVTGYIEQEYIEQADIVDAQRADEAAFRRCRQGFVWAAALM